MSAFATLIARDLKLAVRAGGDMLTLIIFFVLIAILLPFAFGPDRALLARLGPAIVWLAALLSLLLSLDRLFHADREDGTLAALRHGPLPLELVVTAKMAAHWLMGALPLIAVTPVVAVLLGIDGAALGLTLTALVIGTPGLVANATLGAAIAVSLPRGGLIAPAIILPFSIPVLIFGVAAADPAGDSVGAGLMFLAGYSVLATVIAAFAAALALKGAED